ncbi:MAG: RsmE family RNA methyltransferase [Actinomycetota bacterium]
MNWFFAPPEAWSEATITLPPEESRHALQVLRLEPGNSIVVTDGRGSTATCLVDTGGGRSVLARIEGRRTGRRPRPQIVVYQGTAKKGKVDEIVEKLAELGVAELHAFESERSVARWDASKVGRLKERWETIARSAGKQSRNPFFIAAAAGLTWNDLLEKVRAESFALTLWEEASLPLRSGLVAQATRVAIVIGPEGGFTPAEVEALAAAGAPAVSLGPNILRTENASVVAASALLYHYGLLG